MHNSKIQLSAEETELVNNCHWILTKRVIIEKVYRMFGMASQQMQLSAKRFQQLMPAEALPLAPRISKGEQYESLPYVVLDYPGFFTKENVFAVRSFFWWGHYFSITLHLKGKFQEQFGKKIIQAIHNRKLEGYYLSVSGNEFNFNLKEKNYLLLNTETDFLLQKPEPMPFLKISNKISFVHWDTAGERLAEDFQKFSTIIFS